MTKAKYFPGTWLKCKLCVISLLQGEVLLKEDFYFYFILLGICEHFSNLEHLKWCNLLGDCLPFSIIKYIGD